MPDCLSGFHPVSLMNVLDKAGEMIGFIKSQLLRTHLFDVPYDEMVSVLKALLLVELKMVALWKITVCSCLSYKLNLLLFLWSTIFI